MAAINLPQCVLGEQALSRAAWTEALHAFETALQVKESAETLEGLGHAAWWLDRAELVFDSRERAYRLYLANHQPVAAARVAVWLGWDYWAFRGESAVANGWLQRARRLLQSEPTSDLSEHTVHRHVANILNKLNVSTRAAAVAQAARRRIIS